MSDTTDHLYERLPAVYRERDAASGYALRGLLKAITEQEVLIREDIAQLYKNWFIETCQDWVVPYIGDLIGYIPNLGTGETNSITADRDEVRRRLLAPRTEVAKTLHFRRRKGSFSLLGDLANSVAGLPGHAVEYNRLLGVTQNINSLRMERGKTIDVREDDALSKLNGPFDRSGHTIDLRRVDSHHSAGHFNIPSIGVHLWRLRSYPVTKTPAYCFEEEAPNCYHFSALGNDTQLFNKTNNAIGQVVSETNLPIPISRRRLNTFEPIDASQPDQPSLPIDYGEGKSLAIWVGPSPLKTIHAEIVPTDLSNWAYRPLPERVVVDPVKGRITLPEQVAVDPVLGRIMFPPGAARKNGVWVSYHYGFSADIGGGEYNRAIVQFPRASVYQVGEDEPYSRINDALEQWQQDNPTHAVLEITDSGVYVEQILIALKQGQSLQIRAANRTRPIIRLLDWQTSQPDNFTISGESNTWFTLDGLLITGRGVQIEGEISGVTIRHTTLVPGWGLHCDCEPRRTEASLELVNSPACLTIEQSIVGPIHVNRDEVKKDPVLIRISDSILDATDQERLALGSDSEGHCAFAELTVVRSTVFGEILTHSFELAENSLFVGLVLACRRQHGCFRFCYVPTDSRTPRRYHCQPDLALTAVSTLFAQGGVSKVAKDALDEAERLRVTPKFNSTRYGNSAYGQLSSTSANEILEGADDQSELGVFHDLYLPQRIANLRNRLEAHTPAGLDIGIFIAN